MRWYFLLLRMSCATINAPEKWHISEISWDCDLWNGSEPQPRVLLSASNSHVCCLQCWHLTCDLENLSSKHVLFWLNFLLSFSVIITLPIISFWLNVISHHFGCFVSLGRLNFYLFIYLFLLEIMYYLDIFFMLSHPHK